MLSIALSRESGTRLTVNDGKEGVGLGLPDEGIAPRKVRYLGLAGSEPLERAGDALDKPRDRFLKVHGPRPLQRLNWPL